MNKIIVVIGSSLVLQWLKESAFSNSGGVTLIPGQGVLSSHILWGN